jgi:hypothetical protein
LDYGGLVEFTTEEVQSTRLNVEVGVLCPSGTFPPGYGRSRVVLAIDERELKRIQRAVCTSMDVKCWAVKETLGDCKLFDAQVMAEGCTSGFGFAGKDKLTACPLQDMLLSKRLGMLGQCEVELAVNRVQLDPSDKNMSGLDFDLSLYGFFCERTSADFVVDSTDGPSRDFLRLMESRTANWS